MGVPIPLKQKHRVGRSYKMQRPTSDNKNKNRHSWMDEPMNARLAAEHRARSRGPAPRTLLITMGGKRQWT